MIDEQQGVLRDQLDELSLHDVLGRGTLQSLKGIFPEVYLHVQHDPIMPIVEVGYVVHFGVELLDRIGLKVEVTFWGAQIKLKRMPMDD